MRRLLFLLLVLVAAFSAGVLTVLLAWPRAKPLPDPPALVERVREVLRVETVEATLYKKVSFAPEPTPQEGAWQAVFQWAQFTLRPPRGRAMVFAKVHLGYDLRELQATRLQVDQDQIAVTLPPIRAEVELLPGETEFFESTLDSRQTAQLLELAKAAFEREALADAALRARVERSARTGLQAFLLAQGFRVVRFPPAPAM